MKEKEEARMKMTSPNAVITKNKFMNKITRIMA